MNPQSPGTGGRGPYDSWGRPQGESQQPGPQQPGPEYVYEMPEDFQEQQRSARRDSADGNAKGRPQGAKPAPDAPGADSWSVGPSGSPIPGMSATDFQKMCRSVDKAFSQFARIVDQGVNEAAEALGQSPEKNLKAHKELQEKRKREKKARKAQEEAQRRAAQQAYGQQRYGQPGYGAPQGTLGGVPQGFQQAVTSVAQQAQQWAPLAKAKKRFRSSAGLTASGVIMAASGGAGTVFIGIPALIAALDPLAVGVPGLGVTAALGVMTAGFAALLGFGVRNLRRASKLKALTRAVGQREAVTFDDIAARMQVSPKAALSTSRTLIKGGYLPEGRIDDENTTLMVTENAYHQYRQFQQSQRQTLAEREAARAAEAAARAAHEQDISERLTPEQRAFVARGRDYVRQMDELNAAIDDAAVSERITAIQEVVGRILARAEEEPAIIAGLDRLTAYYLPTTVKLLDAYDRLEEEPIQGENISSSRSEIERTLDVLHSAFEKLFDDTYQDLSLDVSADISVLHAMLAQEGLTEGPFDVKP